MPRLDTVVVAARTAPEERKRWKRAMVKREYFISAEGWTVHYIMTASAWWARGRRPEVGFDKEERLGLSAPASFCGFFIARRAG